MTQPHGVASSIRYSANVYPAAKMILGNEPDRIPPHLLRTTIVVTPTNFNTAPPKSVFGRCWCSLKSRTLAYASSVGVEVAWIVSAVALRAFSRNSSILDPLLDSLLFTGVLLPNVGSIALGIRRVMTIMHHSEIDVNDIPSIEVASRIERDEKRKDCACSILPMVCKAFGLVVSAIGTNLVWNTKNEALYFPPFVSNLAAATTSSLIQGGVELFLQREQNR